jgi:hypothetical protein
MEKVGVNYAQSDFNMGLAILERINGLLNIVAEAKLVMDFKTWRDSLMTISDEMADSYSREVEGEFLSLVRSINPLLSRSVPRYVFGNDRPQADITEEEYNDLYIKLRELDKFVRLQLNLRNMLLKKSKDQSKASSRMS